MYGEKISIIHKSITEQQTISSVTANEVCRRLIEQTLWFVMDEQKQRSHLVLQRVTNTNTTKNTP